jgi:glycosyltransferase involved in cell wall biosynthesis
LPSRQSSSWQEVFGIVVIEALACGVFPIVAGQIGPREIVSESIGDILEADDFSDLEEIIRKFGRLSPKKKRAIAEEAKEHAKKYRAVDLAENWSLLGAN